MKEVYDLIGIGIGPFNLGLAALTESIPTLQTVFLEQKKCFSWHEGLMIDGATLQVPFYADLVTLADPCNKYSFLNFLKAKNRMFRFACNENYYIERKEYQQYCQWVACNLQSLCFDQQVIAVDYDDDSKHYVVTAQNGNNETVVYCGKHLVIGVGSQPSVPSFAVGMLTDESVLHAGNYLDYKQQLLRKQHITIVGSGQSAAEIFYDLLKQKPSIGYSLDWFTRSNGFYQMETSRLMCELTSPDYIDYFYQLPAETKTGVLRKQDHLYKGINRELIDAIYCELYSQSINEDWPSVNLMASVELTGIKVLHNSTLQLKWQQLDQQALFETKTNALILATGYAYKQPGFLKGICKRINLNTEGSYHIARNYSIDLNGNEIFVQNAELNSHGFTAPDLGIGPYRNMMIINDVLNFPQYQIGKKTMFQDFGI